MYDFLIKVNMMTAIFEKLGNIFTYLLFVFHLKSIYSSVASGRQFRYAAVRRRKGKIARQLEEVSGFVRKLL